MAAVISIASLCSSNALVGRSIDDRHAIRTEPIPHPCRCAATRRPFGRASRRAAGSVGCRNCLALRAHEKLQRVRAAGGARESQRLEAGVPKVLTEHPDGRSPITSRGPVTGKAATGTPQDSASSWTMPKVSVRLGKTNTSAAARWAASLSPHMEPRKRRSG